MLQSLSDPKRATAVLLTGVALVAALLLLWWPAGTLVGLAAGLLAVHRIGTAMQRQADAQPWADLQEVTSWLADEPAYSEKQAQAEPVVQPAAVAHPAHAAAAVWVDITPDPEAGTAPARQAPATHAPIRDEIRSQLSGLKSQLGDDYPDFARAARLVVETQYASAARLQRELHVPYSRARRLLGDLEQQHFVGPATGSLPRQVLMPKDRLPELEELLTV
jgi:hypothetical protein